MNPIQSIWGVGRNYSDHAKEMNAPVPSQPLIFLKSGGTAIQKNVFCLPTFSKEVHHELEIFVQLDKDLKPFQMCLALDLTLRDIQQKAKQAGEPWTLSKSFQDATPHGPWRPYDAKTFNQLWFRLYVNEEARQEGQTKQMIFQLPALLEHLKSHYPLRPYDGILTGTPSGVGPLKAGQHLTAEWGTSSETFQSMTWTIEG